MTEDNNNPLIMVSSFYNFNIATKSNITVCKPHLTLRKKMKQFSNALLNP